METKEDYTRMCRETIDDVAMFITLVDDPELSNDKRLHWLKVLALIKADL